MAPTTTTQFDEVYAHSSTPLSSSSTSNHSNIYQHFYLINSSIPLHRSYPNTVVGYNKWSIIQPQPVKLSYPTTYQLKYTQERILILILNSPKTTSHFDSSNI